MATLVDNNNLVTFIANKIINRAIKKKFGNDANIVLDDLSLITFTSFENSDDGKDMFEVKGTVRLQCSKEQILDMIL